MWSCKDNEEQEWNGTLVAKNLKAPVGTIGTLNYTTLNPPIVAGGSNWVSGAGIIYPLTGTQIVSGAGFITAGTISGAYIYDVGALDVGGKISGATTFQISGANFIINSSGAVGIKNSNPYCLLAVGGVGRTDAVIYGIGGTYTIWGESAGTAGIYGKGGTYGIYGTGSTGVYGTGTYGVYGHSNLYYGVYGNSNAGSYGTYAGVKGVGFDSTGVHGYGNVGVMGEGTSYDFYGKTTTGKSYFAGNVGIGTLIPQGLLDVSGAIAMVIPRITSVQMEALSVNGMICYNATSAAFYFRENGAWVTK